jgi:hypothetical protein
VKGKIMSWFDEEIAMETASDSPSSWLGDINANLGDDLTEAIGMAFTDGIPPWASALSSATFGWGGNSKPGEDAMSRAAAALPRAANNAVEEEGIIGRFSKWVDNNKGLSEVLAKGIASAAKGNEAKEAAKVMAQSRLEELKLKNQQDREKDAQVSASVSGLRQPGGLMTRGALNGTPDPSAQQPSGLIGRAGLRRVDGTPVFQNGRIA